MLWGPSCSMKPSDGIKNGREVQMGSVNKLNGFIQGVGLITHMLEIVDKITQSFGLSSIFP